MANSRETSNKKETEKLKQQKKKNKEQKKEERRAQAKTGNDWEQMLAYVDENGNLSSVPADATKKQAISEQEISIGVAKQVASPEPVLRTGSVSFFNSAKGYGFILDQANQQRVFVHVNGLLEPIQENDRVSFQVEKGLKGPNAVKVKRLP